MTVGVGRTVFIDKGHIKIPFSKIVPMIDNVSNVGEIIFGNLLAIGIYKAFVRISAPMFVIVRTRVFCLTNPIEVIARVGITLGKAINEGVGSRKSFIKIETVVAPSISVGTTFSSNTVPTIMLPNVVLFSSQYVCAMPKQAKGYMPRVKAHG